mgnify:CR=1 FL=1|jgi:hypothetical protein
MYLIIRAKLFKREWTLCHIELFRIPQVDIGVDITLFARKEPTSRPPMR